MENASYSLLVVTFYNDLPNLRIFLFLLNKFWLGNKDIKIIYSLKANYDQLIEASYIRPLVEDAVTLLGKEWNVQVCEAQYNELSGYNDQQYSKYLYSESSDKTWTVVFDCQNFLINFCDFKDFFVNNKVISLRDDVVDLWTKCAKEDLQLGQEEPNCSIEPLTPWVWKNSDVANTKNFLISKFGPLETRKGFPGSEYVNVYLYKLFVEMNNEEDLYCFVKNRNLPVLYHHRIRNIDHIQNNAYILKRAGVPDNEIIRWAKDSPFYAYVNPLKI